MSDVNNLGRPRLKKGDPPTKAQGETLEFIISYIEENLRPPTVREIADNFGITINAIRCRIIGLQKRELILREDGTSRSYIPAGMKAYLYFEEDDEGK
jgi:SOS-response transcriptional repressor LexA